MKDNSKEEIITAIQCAIRKQRYICNHVSNLLLSGTGSPSVTSSTDNHLLTQQKEYSKRNRTGQNDKRDCSKEKP